MGLQEPAAPRVRMRGEASEAFALEPERARRALWAGILVFRWAFYAWMVVLAFTSGRPLRYPALAWVTIGAIGAWTVWLTIPRMQERPETPWIDLALAVALTLLSGIVVERGEAVGRHPFFAVSYPTSAVLLWGASRGLGGGLLAGATVAIATGLSRAVNGVPLGEWTSGRVQGLVNTAVYNLSAGAVTGIMSRLFDRWSVQFRSVMEDAVRARERAARLAERETLIRVIHDSALQTLSLIHKRGFEIGLREGRTEGSLRSEVRRLAEIAGEQEQALRALILREPEAPRTGVRSLREALEAEAQSTTELPVSVSAVGPIWLPGPEVHQLAAAIRQALDNVVVHANAQKAAVFAEARDGWVRVSVRDDGRGFVYDEELLRAAGKVGILRSMKGRVEELGGWMRVESAPGRGTEVELRVPERPGAELR